MQYTAFAVAIVLIEVYMKERFRDFAGISNSNHFFQLGPLLHIIVIIIDKKNIYILLVATKSPPPPTSWVFLFLQSPVLFGF